MKPPPFSYARPGSLAEATSILAEEPHAKVLAGGQSLIPLLSMRLARPSLLVDINRLPGLADIEVSEAGVRVGALARHAEVLASAEVRRVQPLVSLALSNVAHATIRNRGTTVGSIVHADAAAEMPVVLAVLGGSVDAESTAGRRTIAAADLFVGPLETSLRQDEIAVSAWFPALGPGEGVGFEEIARRHGDYAICGVAALVRLDGDRVVEARAGYVSVNEVPVVVDLTPAFAQGSDDAGYGDAGYDHAGYDDAVYEQAGELALASLDTTADLHATAEYRAQLARVLTARALRSAYADARDRARRRA